MNIDEYMQLPYTRLIQEENDETGHYFYGKILELDGCQSTGDTLDELNTSLTEAMRGYLETKMEFGLPIPMPMKKSSFSGKFVIRIPRSLHQRLAVEAKQEGVSLNQLALCKLSR
ncbi:type II toxin-antitoxin system HicB family antitoxin [Bilifractor sp. HCP3S3_D3]|uniref:type II toxin-antitoxin system HicB family antitoxin n=1 Tax=Bilifractor sp. HCP3S3_D3 TaxID=3438907 RepID=UPI003F888ACF